MLAAAMVAAMAVRAARVAALGWEADSAVTEVVATEPRAGPIRGAPTLRSRRIWGSQT